MDFRSSIKKYIRPQFLDEEIIDKLASAVVDAFNNRRLSKSNITFRGSDIVSIDGIKLNSDGTIIVTAPYVRERKPGRYVVQ